MSRARHLSSLCHPKPTVSLSTKTLHVLLSTKTHHLSGSAKTSHVFLSIKTYRLSVNQNKHGTHVGILPSRAMEAHQLTSSAMKTWRQWHFMHSRHTMKNHVRPKKNQTLQQKFSQNSGQLTCVSHQNHLAISIPLPNATFSFCTKAQHRTQPSPFEHLTLRCSMHHALESIWQLKHLTCLRSQLSPNAKTPAAITEFAGRHGVSSVPCVTTCSVPRRLQHVNWKGPCATAPARRAAKLRSLSLSLSLSLSRLSHTRCKLTPDHELALKTKATWIVATTCHIKKLLCCSESPNLMIATGNLSL